MQDMAQLAGIQLRSPVLLAPMAGFTDGPYRRLAAEFGAGMVFTELVSSEGIIRRNKKTIDLLRFNDQERPIGIQVFGSDPAVVAEAAAFVETLGPDCIDINMGCCAPKVCYNGKGAALLKDPELVHRIAVTVGQAVSLPVSAKIRLGWDSDSINYNEVVYALVEGNVSFISVHGRTRAQLYRGEADWESITEIARSCPVPVVGNGDILSYEDAMEKLNTTGCTAVMVGRGAQGNPWIFSSSEPTLHERLDVIRRHYHLMIEEYGEYGMVLMRKHVVRYIHGIRNATKIRSKLVVADTMEEIESLLQQVIQ